MFFPFFQLQNCSELLKTNPVFDSPDFGAYYILFPNEFFRWNNKVRESLSRAVVKYKKAKLVQSKIKTTKEWKEKISKFLSLPIAEKFVENNMVQDNSLLLMAYGNKNEAVSLNYYRF